MALTQETAEEPLTYWDWLTTPCEYCGMRLAYCSCDEGDEPEDNPR